MPVPFPPPAGHALPTLSVQTVIKQALSLLHPDPGSKEEQAAWLLRTTLGLLGEDPLTLCQPPDSAPLPADWLWVQSSGSAEAQLLVQVRQWGVVSQLEWGVECVPHHYYGLPGVLTLVAEDIVRRGTMDEVRKLNVAAAHGKPTQPLAGAQA